MQPHPTESPLVFLPGFGFSAQVWRKLTDQLVHEDCHLIDLPTLSEKTVPNHDPLQTVIEKLRPQIPNHAILIGWSLGGLIALALSRVIPEKCRGLFLMTSTPEFSASDAWAGIAKATFSQFQTLNHNDPTRLFQKLCALISVPQRNLALIHYLKSHLAKPDTLSHALYLQILEHTDLREQYQQLSIPCLHLQGEHDAIVSHNFSNNHCITLKNAGHIPFFTHTAIVLTSLKVFIDECTPKTIAV